MSSALRPSWYRAAWVAIVLGGATSAAWGQLYDKVRFSPPREASTARPTTPNSELEGRVGVSRREGHSLASEMPAGMALPAPEDVNRLRLLQSLLERRRDQGAGLDSGSGSEGSLGDTLGGDDLGVQLNIDDLFERYGMSRESKDRGSDNESRWDRRRDDARRRGDDGSGNSVDGRDSRQDDGDGESGRGGANGEEDSRFIPSMDARDRDFRKSLQGDTDRASAGFLRADPSGLGSASGARDREEAARLRSERSEAIRRLIGGNRAATDAVGGARTGPGGARAVPGVAGTAAGGGLGVPGPGAGRSLGEFMSSRPAASPTGPAPDALVGGGMDRSLAMPSRPTGLDLRPSLGGSARSGVESMIPAPRPMQLFQQKHDTRIPVRPF